MPIGDSYFIDTLATATWTPTVIPSQMSIDSRFGASIFAHEFWAAVGKRMGKRHDQPAKEEVEIEEIKLGFLTARVRAYQEGTSRLFCCDLRCVRCGVLKTFNMPGYPKELEQADSAAAKWAREHTATCNGTNRV